MKRMKLFTLLMFLLTVPPGISEAATELVDYVVAVVGDEIILLSELQKQLNDEMMRRKLNFQSPREVLLNLREETIRGMIDNVLLLEKAQRDSIKVDMREVDFELNNRIARLKEQMGNEEAYLKGLEEYGFTELQFRNMQRDLIYKDALRMSLLRNMTWLISVTPQDIEGWFSANKDSLPQVPEMFKLSHILIYSQVSEERKKEARDKAQQILDMLRNGADFAELAKKYSDDTLNAPNGGDLGYFKREEFDRDFSTAAFALKNEEISGIVETQFGFHIIKVDDIRGDEVKARHILIQLTPGEADENRVREKLQQIRDDILAGKSTFEDTAKKNSEDENSRDLGGKLDWLTRDVMIPAFQLEAEKLKPGELSEPFKSQYGYHILKLDAYKPAHILNIKDDRSRIEELIKGKKTLDEYERILQELRKETYIDIRLD